MANIASLRRLAPIAAVLGTLACSSGGGACGKNKDIYPAPDPSQVTTLRNDLMYGYYGDCPTCLSETKAHVNMYWINGFFDNGDYNATVAARIAEARDAGIDHVFVHVPQAYQANPEQGVRTLLTLLHAQGLLSHVSALYPIDEPDGAHKSDATVTQTNQMLRRVMAEFPEMASVKLAVIYTGGGDRPGLATYDWVGFDDYDKGVGIFTQGAYQSFKAALRPDQKIMLVPGGAEPWKQDPGAFFAQAELDPQVMGVFPFIWFDHSDNGVGKGIRSDGMTQDYCIVGKKIKSQTPNPVCP